MLRIFKYPFSVFLVIFCFLAPSVAFSQQEKPKVALVLSGGGAKGLAHVAVIQTLDSLGIVPDLIIGTSMGSIVGGLYAMGYSGNEIAKIANEADWDDLLGGDVKLNNVSVEEKSEFKKYLIELDIVKWKPKVNSSLLRDQKLREFLSKATFPVYGITDFDSLPIPFRAMATDIVNGKEVALGSGSLAVAMRASMSIPSIFEPVEYENTLLVDGGILNNFPVDLAVEMGADIIIGSNVGNGMLSKDELESFSDILFQTSMMASNLKNDENLKLCDILIDHAPHLTYSTGDFNNSIEIYEEGKIATKLNIDAFVELANTLKSYKQKAHEVPYRKDEIILDTIIYKGISEVNLELVKARTKIEPQKAYASQELIDGVNRALGTRMFTKITFKPVKENGKIGLQLTGKEHSKNQFKGALHFDTNRGVGLILNYTGRNIIGNSSRLVFDIDIAEQPKLRLQYQKNFTKNKNWWFRTEAFGVLLNQEIFFEGTGIDDIKYNYFQFDNQVNRNFNSLSSFIGLGLNYEYTKLKPKVDPNIVGNIFGLDEYYFNNIEINLHYTYNTLNNVFFATKGTMFRANISRSILHEVYLKTTDVDVDVLKGETNGFSKLNLQFEKRIKLNKKLTGIINASANFIFEDDLDTGEISFQDYGYAANYFLGGNMDNARNNSHVFPGLKEDELNVSQFMKLDLGVQFKLINKVYVVPHVNIASVGFLGFNDYIEDAFNPKGDWTNQLDTSAIFATGLTVSYHSILGPVNFDLSYVNDIDKLRLFFSVGLLFNESK
ncbi:MAG: patatin-like phospholipase family protein [Flavobacteriaceae bacterium]|nr:patatin-like phospholipase family protein [Flavobacteriaceae bacterium]